MNRINAMDPEVEIRYVDEDGPKESWIRDHPSAALSLFLAAVTLAQWAGLAWLEQKQAPQWEAVNAQLTKLAKRDVMIANYQFEQDRHVRDVLEVICESGGIKMPPRPEELERAAMRARAIQEMMDL